MHFGGSNIRHAKSSGSGLAISAASASGSAASGIVGVVRMTVNAFTTSSGALVAKWLRGAASQLRRRHLFLASKPSSADVDSLQGKMPTKS